MKTKISFPKKKIKPRKTTIRPNSLEKQHNTALGVSTFEICPYLHALALEVARLMHLTLWLPVPTLCGFQPQNCLRNVFEMFCLSFDPHRKNRWKCFINTTYGWLCCGKFFEVSLRYTYISKYFLFFSAVCFFYLFMSLRRVGLQHYGIFMFVSTCRSWFTGVAALSQHVKTL